MTDARQHTNLGITGVDHFEYVVTDLASARELLVERMGFVETARSSAAMAAASGEDAVLLSAGHVQVVVVAPREGWSRAARWLRRHPEGVAVMAYRVRDAAAARVTLAGRSATFVDEVQVGASGAQKWFDIATPLGDVRFRFVEHPTGSLPPGLEPLPGVEAANPFGFQVVDHVTSNMLTLEPHITWLRDVMGFEEYWRVTFHTSDVHGGSGGSGLASIVMWDPESGVKLANNEPHAPNFEASQIYAFVDANHGPGIQHIALHVPDIVTAVEGLRARGVDFLPTPGSYYDMLPARLADRRVTNFRDDIAELRRLGILVDGEDDRYLLQIFSVEAQALQGREVGGPFFWEVIRRRGARGFGEGNFRALFEAIEREQERRAEDGGAA